MQMEKEGGRGREKNKGEKKGRKEREQGPGVSWE